MTRLTVTPLVVKSSRSGVLAPASFAQPVHVGI
jgi:hypothetical protein